MKQRTDFFDELLSKTDLVRLIGGYVPLTKKGNSYWGCCPFHLEKTPSFCVNSEKQLYHCFGCKESGNAITFLKKIENIESFDAVKILAKEAKMEIPESNFVKNDSKELIEKRERLHLLMRDAAKKYHKNLFLSEAKAAKEYLNDRGIDDKLITKFGLGYSLNGTDIINHLKSLNYTEQEMKDAGVAEVSARGYYDVFYDRIMFPIINNLNEVVGFGGRTLVKNPDFAKYRNSSQTIIFDKSKTVYGINLLKKLKFQSKKIEHVIMVEGYMDVIALHKAGFETAVASMGTALTYNQAKQIRNYCNKVLISYDGDTAGQSATLRSLDILESAGLNVRVVSLPSGLDPDDIIKKHGAEFYQKLLGSAIPLIEFKIESLKKQHDITDTEGKSKFTVEAIKIIKSLENPVEREDYLRKLQDITGYSMDVLLAQADITVTVQKSELSKLSAAGNDENNLHSDKMNDKIIRSKNFILASMAANREYVSYREDYAEAVWDEFEQYLLEYFKKNHEKGVINNSVLYTAVEENHHAYLDKILNYEFIDGDNEGKFKHCLNALREDYLDKEIKRVTILWKETKNMQLLNTIKELQERQRLAKRGGDIDE